MLLIWMVYNFVIWHRVKTVNLIILTEAWHEYAKNFIVVALAEKVKVFR